MSARDFNICASIRMNKAFNVEVK
ncbi:protein of unknown function [Nitratireductor aquimarinus]